MGLWRRGAATVLACVAAGAAAGPARAASGPDGIDVQTLHVDVAVGPDDATHCDVVGDLYRPPGVDAAHPAPAVLATNGFGGSKDDQRGLALDFARHGYVALSYSGLGFGGSGCKIELDDRDWDGKAAAQLVSFLGGSKAATDGTKVDYVLRDPVAHDGSRRADDPRVGMIGGSYGGQVQFAAAADDPRIDTILPIVTWNDLSYSLGPNGTDIGDGVTSRTPGALKLIWALFFTGEGAIVDSVTGAQNDPSRLAGCPNFDDRVCRDLVPSAIGAPTPDLIALLRHASVATFMDRIRIPVMLWQGEHDTLFNLNESVATYRALKARGVPVKLVWQSWGHSGLKPAPGELADGADGYALGEPVTYEGQLALQWFDHYLRGGADTPSLDFSYFRDWVRYDGSAAPAYGHAASFPAGTPRPLYLSRAGDLVGDRGELAAGASTLTIPPLGLPTSLSEISALNGNVGTVAGAVDAPGTAVTYTTGALPDDLDVAGVPTATLHVAAPLSSGASGPNGLVTLYVKLYDVAPDGSVTLPGSLVTPIRIGDATKPVQVQMTGLVHRFARGHRIRLVVAATDAAYRGTITPQPVTIRTSPSDPSTLALPLVGGDTVAGCTPASRLRFTLHHRRGDRVVSAVARVGRRRIAARTGRALTTLTARRPTGSAFSVRVTTRSAHGITRVSTRRFAGCAKTAPKTTAHRKRRRPRH